jgi:histidine triad (HIT) family protein
MSAEQDCPFCRIAKGELPAVKLFEDQDVLAIMDRYPATPAHVLVLPKRHIGDIYDMPGDLGCRVIEVATVVCRAIKSELNPQGLNLVQANGAAAGQTISHFHLHIVPRYENDAVILNFGHGKIPASQTDLETIARKLRPAFLWPLP